MSDTNQATADSNDQTTVADPLQDAANSTQSGTNHFSDYEAELAAALAEDHVSNELAAEVAPEVTTEEHADVEEVEGETEEFSDEVEPAEAKARERFRFKDPADQAVAAIAKAKGITLIEAARLYEGESPTQRQEAASEQPATEQRETSASVQQRIEQLEELEAQASTELEFATANEHRKEANKLRNQLIDLKIAEVQERSNADAIAEREFYANYAKSSDKTLAFYPDLADPKSQMSLRVAELDRQAKELGDPIYHSDNKPWIMVTQAAKELGVLMKRPDAGPKKVSTNRPMQPASGNARTTATAPAVRQEEAIDKIDGIQAYEKFVAGLR